MPASPRVGTFSGRSLSSRAVTREPAGPADAFILARAHDGCCASDGAEEHMVGEAGAAKTVAVPSGEAEAAPEWTPPSWDDLVRQHSARVYRLAYRLTGNMHEDRKSTRLN